MVDSLRRIPVCVWPVWVWPAWVWLAGIVLGSFVLRAWLARGMVAPFIMVDELIFADLGRSVAGGDGFRVRGEPYFLSVVYPLLIAPAYAIFDELPSAYAAVKTLNALFMSLAAVPAYLIARRVLAPPLSLFASVLTVAVPSMAYTGTVMSENAFYPLFLTAALLLVLVLERPTLWRQVALLMVVGVAVATRLQGIALVPAILIAPVLLAAVEGRGLRRTVAPFRGLYAVILGGGVLVLLAQAARGRSPNELLGAYSIVGDTAYDPVEVARYFLYHLAELDLYLGVLPVAGLVLVTALARGLGPRVGSFVAAAIAVSLSVLLVVGAFASEFISTRIQERNTFFVAPLFLIALLVWIERGTPRPRALAIAAAVGAGLLPLAIPFERFIETGAISDTLALLPIWSAFGSLLFDSIDATVLIGGLLATGLFLLVPRRYALAVPAATFLYFAVVSYNVWAGERGFEQASRGALFEGIRVGHRDWIDRVLPEGEQAAFVWRGVTDRFAVNQNEFFNGRVGPVYFIGGPTPGGLAEAEVAIDEESGQIRTTDGRPVEARYVLTEDAISPDGIVLARDPGIGLTLWRTAGPLVATATQVEGLYPNDTWSGRTGRTVTWTRERCRGGTLTVTLSSDPNLFDQDQVVTATVAGRIADHTVIKPTGIGRLRVRTVPVEGTCRVVFRVALTKVPGGADRRELGAHFKTFDYRP